MWQTAKSKAMCESSQTLRCCAYQNGNKGYNARLISLNMDPNINWGLQLIHSLGCGLWTPLLTLICNFYVFFCHVWLGLWVVTIDANENEGNITYIFLALVFVSSEFFFFHRTSVLGSTFGESLICWISLWGLETACSLASLW